MSKAAATDVNESFPEDISLWRLIGQESAVEILTRAVDEKFNNTIDGLKQTLNTTILIVGERGLGHETLARAFSNSIGNISFKIGLGEVLGFGYNMYDFFINGNSETFYISSGERLAPYYQHDIYKVINGTLSVSIPLEQRKEEYEIENKLIIIGAVDVKSFMPSFLKAINIRVALSKYDEETLFKILRQRVEYMGWKIRSDEVLRVISRRSKGNVGNAVKILLQGAYRIMRSENKNVIGISHVNKALNWSTSSY